MIRNSIVPLVALIALLAASATVSAQGDENGHKFGLGIEAENISYALADAEEERFFELRTVSTTPALLVSFRPTPHFIVEPSFGIFMTKYNTGRPADTTMGSSGSELEQTIRNIKLGIGFLYATHPDRLLTPFIHGKVDFNLLKFEEVGTYSWFDGVTMRTSDYKFEMPTKALVLAGGLGGMMNIKDQVGLTLEARILYGRVFDPEREISSSTGDGFEDTVETTRSAVETDMVIGLRVFF